MTVQRVCIPTNDVLFSIKYKSNMPRRWILLDFQLTLDLFYNGELLESIGNA